MRSVLAPLAMALIVGCDGYGDGDMVSPSAPAFVTLTMSSPDVMTSAGETRSVTAVVKDAYQVVIASPALSWSTSAGDVATVVATEGGATITAVGDGTATITATSGSVRGSVTVTVRRVLASVVVSGPSAVLVLGSTMQLTATGRDARQHEIGDLTGFTYSSSNPGSVVVSSSGVVTGLFSFGQDPSAIITAAATRDGVTASGSIELRVIPPTGFDFATVMLGDFERPTPVATSGLGIAHFTVRSAGIDYTITWSALSGPGISAHVHGPGTARDVADVLVDFPLGDQSTNHAALTGSLTARDVRPQGGRPAISVDSLITLLGNGNAYVDVHTTAFAGGEIRGQVAGPFGLRRGSDAFQRVSASAISIHNGDGDDEGFQQCRIDRGSPEDIAVPGSVRTDAFGERRIRVVGASPVDAPHQPERSVRPVESAGALLTPAADRRARGTSMRAREQPMTIPLLQLDRRQIR